MSMRVDRLRLLNALSSSWLGVACAWYWVASAWLLIIDCVWLEGSWVRGDSGRHQCCCVTAYLFAVKTAEKALKRNKLTHYFPKPPEQLTSQREFCSPLNSREKAKWSHYWNHLSRRNLRTSTCSSIPRVNPDVSRYVLIYLELWYYLDVWVHFFRVAYHGDPSHFFGISISRYQIQPVAVFFGR